MVSWQDFQTLRLEAPLESFARLHPSFYQLYADKEDSFGFKIETFVFWEHIFRFLFEDYFKVQVKGIENIPAQGRVMLVGNHSGLLPVDGAMMAVAICKQHPNPRRIRFLATDWFFQVPGLREWASEIGCVRATQENARHLLEEEEIVGIYPEGIRGIGKPFQERYRLHNFHPGFVKLALETQTPLVPVATVGGDEIYPTATHLVSLARLLRMPFFPLTPTFPWLPAPLMFTPLPVAWLIKIHKPIKLEYPPEKANDRKLVIRIAKEIQYQIQRDLNELLRERKSVFSGWDG